MLGAIIGDIVGSRFEFNNHRSKDFELFTEDCFVTDDSIMTLAVAKAIMEAVKASPEAWKARDDRFHDLLSSLTVKYMQEIGRQYPGCGYGGRFYEWMFSDDPKPYKSYGNGAAMRVSPAGIIAESLIDAWSLAETVTAVTHNHKEGIKGAQATATSIYLAKTGALKSEIRKYTEADYYPLDFTIDAIRPSYRFNETCQQTVPQAIQCFLEAASFEDAIRTAISLGGDSDTLAAITGAIAGAYYGIPEALGQKALTYLDPRLRAIYDEWIRFCPPERERYKLLTKYIGKFSARAPGGPPGPAFHTRFPHHEFSKEWYSSAFVRTNYRAGLEKMKIGQLYDDSLTMAVEGLDAEEVLTLITAAFRHDHFDNGMLDRYLESGIMLKWLKRLKDIDWQERSPVIKEVELYRSIWPMFPRQYRVSLDGGKAVFEKNTHPQNRDGEDKQQEEAARVRRALEDLHFEYWLADYQPPDGLLVLDGEQWKLAVTYSDGTVFRSGGSNAYPDN